MSEVETVELKVIEEMARQQGWSPDKGELGALEFLGNGREFRDRLFKKVDKAERDANKAYQIVADHITNVQKKEHAESQKAIEQQIKEATEDGDTEKVLELTKQIKEPPKEVDPNQELIVDWTKENKWFTDNAEMRDDAMGFYQAEIAKNGGVDDPSVILPAVKARIEKVHKDYFKPSNSNENRESGADKESVKKSNAKGLTKSDLTEDEAAHFDQFVSMGMDEKRLLENIENARRKRNA